MKNLKEQGRERFGGHDDGKTARKAINAHSERRYADAKGNVFRLCRDLDAEGRPFEAYGPYRESHAGILPAYPMNGERSFGSGNSWETAEKALDAAVGADLNGDYARDLVVTPARDPDSDFGWAVVQEGFSGVRIEVWRVTQEILDRGTWGRWITDPGFHWQRMDRAEIHGPFETLDAAVADSKANRDTPGVKPGDSDDAPAPGPAR
jgi:hypothetical protein